MLTVGVSRGATTVRKPTYFGAVRSGGSAANVKGCIIMRIYYAKDYDEMSRKAADIIAAQVLLKPNCVLGLATGSSPIGTYKELIARYEKGDLDFSAVTAANLDEYVGLTKDNDQSYAYFMRTNLFDHINIDQTKTNIPDGTNPDAAAECKRYDAALEALGGVDLQLLGIGNNGHIGFNEPSDGFANGTNCVNLTDSTIEANKRFFARKEDVPTQAYTMGVGCIMRAGTVLLIASGAAKSKIICEMATGKVTPQVPASVLQMHKNAIIIADDAALQDLLKTAPELVNGRP